MRYTRFRAETARDRRAAPAASTLFRIASEFRAWRRPLRPDESARLFATLRAGGEGDEDALCLLMRAIMLSLKFLYRAHDRRRR